MDVTWDKVLQMPSNITWLNNLVQETSRCYFTCLDFILFVLIYVIPEGIIEIPVGLDLDPENSDFAYDQSPSSVQLLVQ